MSVSPTNDVDNNAADADGNDAAVLADDSLGRVHQQKEIKRCVDAPGQRSLLSVDGCSDSGVASRLWKLAHVINSNET